MKSEITVTTGTFCTVLKNISQQGPALRGYTINSIFCKLIKSGQGVSLENFSHGIALEQGLMKQIILTCT